MFDTSRGWRFHGGFLLALLLFYFFLTRDDGHEKKPFDFSGLATVILMVMYVIYAAVTTTLMPWVGRLRGGPVVMHALGMALWGGSLMYKRLKLERYDAEYALEHADEIRERKERLLLKECLVLDELRVYRQAPMRIELHVHSSGCPRLTVRDPSAGAFRPESNQIFGSLADRQGQAIEEGGAAVLTASSVLPKEDLGPYDDWSFQASLSITAPQLVEVSYCTPGAPTVSHCLPIGKVTFAGER